MSQAYIFDGENFDAARSNALAFAKGLNCENENACGACLSCRTFDSGNHPDTFFIKSAKQSIGVDDVREQIIMPMATKPFKYNHKIFIVENSLTPAAQNALLKTIEEPAPYGIFLFIGSTFDFLPTILSRCVVKKVREKFFYENDSLAEEISEKIQRADIIEAFALYRRVESLDKNTLSNFLDNLYIIFGKKNRRAPSQSLINAAEAIARTKKILSQNGNTQLAIELMLLDLRI